MGRQVNFWMMEQDAQEFARFVHERHGVFIADLSPDRELKILATLPSPPQRWWWSLWIGNVDLPFEPRWVRVREGPETGMYAFAPWDDDPVIQFHQSILRDSGGLSQARIWTGCRETAFLTWYESLARWLRTRLVKVEKRGNLWLYAGPQAARWHAEGGRLED